MTPRMRNRGCCNPIAGDDEALTRSPDLEDEVDEVIARTTVGETRAQSQRVHGNSRFSRDGHGSFRKGAQGPAPMNSGNLVTTVTVANEDSARGRRAGGKSKA